MDATVPQRNHLSMHARPGRFRHFRAHPPHLGNPAAWPRRWQAHHPRRSSYEPSHRATDCSRKRKRLPTPRNREPRRPSAASAASAADSLRKAAARATRWPFPPLEPARQSDTNYRRPHALPPKARKKATRVTRSVGSILMQGFNCDAPWTG